jgi:hypothetical protein
MFGLSVFALFGAALGHTIVRGGVTPRDNNVHWEKDSGCGNSRQINNYFKRGEEVDFEWAANNHHGGFTQVSIMPLSSDPNTDAEAFDRPDNVVYVTCYNKNSCKPAGGGDEFGLGQDGTGTWGNVCRDKFTIPAYFQDGEYVMKVSIFGNGVNWGIRNMPHPTYGNCHNFRLSGGASLSEKPSQRAHIHWNLYDVAIQRMNAEKGWSIQQDQCLFLGANRRNGCEGGIYDGGGWYGDCKGSVADISRCGEGQADTFQECESGGNWNWVSGTKWQPGGAKLYNYMVGVPVHHPKYNGEFTMLSHVRAPKLVKVEVPANELFDGGASGGKSSAGGNASTGGNTGSEKTDSIELWLSAADRQALPEFLMGAAAALVAFSAIAVTER